MKQHFLAGFMSLFSGEKLASRFAPHARDEPATPSVNLAMREMDSASRP